MFAGACLDERCLKNCVGNPRRARNFCRAFWLRPLRRAKHCLAVFLTVKPSLFIAASLPPDTSEHAFRDARWIIAVLGIIFFSPRSQSSTASRERLKEPATGLLFAFTIGYLAWLFEFGYQRYAAPLDILRGAVLLILAIGLPAKWLKSGGTMVVPNWGHLPWWPYWRSINPQPAMVSRRPGSGYPQVPSKVDSAK
jgi:hypothetical protein